MPTGISLIYTIVKATPELFWGLAVIGNAGKRATHTPLLRNEVKPRRSVKKAMSRR